MGEAEGNNEGGRKGGILNRNLCARARESRGAAGRRCASGHHSRQSQGSQARQSGGAAGKAVAVARSLGGGGGWPPPPPPGGHAHATRWATPLPQRARPCCSHSPRWRTPGRRPWLQGGGGNKGLHKVSMCACGRWETPSSRLPPRAARAPACVSQRVQEAGERPAATGDLTHPRTGPQWRGRRSGSWLRGRLEAGGEGWEAREEERMVENKAAQADLCSAVPKPSAATCPAGETLAAAGPPAPRPLPPASASYFRPPRAPRHL